MTPRTLAFVVGAALILVANGVALSGVAANRSGEPDSRLELSQRELGRPWSWRGNKENSGLALTLAWRVPAPDTESYHPYYGNQGGSPAWLDDQRMAELGFDVERARGKDARSRRYIDQAEHQVLVVLELAGPDWRQAVERARRQLAHRQSLREASPGAKELIDAEQRAQEALAREENTNSRLFAVDVGTDLATLRTKYPDRGRYLILRGELRLRTTVRDKLPVVSGYLGDLEVRQINVPHALRGTFEAMPPRAGGPMQDQPPFTATLAVGRRLEPWIEAVSTP